MEEQETLSYTPPTAEPKLIGVGELLKASWKIYKSRFWIFFGIIAIPALVSFFLIFLFSIFGIASVLALKALGIGIIILLVIVLIFLSAILTIWPQIALLYLIKEREEAITVKQAFGKAWHKILSYWWIAFLNSLIITGGFMLFLIPGFVFAIWFSLAMYVLITEDKKGMNALLRSKQLVKGYWWKVFWRLAVILSIAMIIILPATFICEALHISFISQIFSLVVAPLIFIFTFLVYEDLKQVKVGVSFEPPSTGKKLAFISAGIIGALLIPGIFGAIVLTSTSNARKRANDARAIAAMLQMRLATELIYVQENNSYSNVSCNHPDLVSSCNDIANKIGEKLMIYSSRDAYCMYIRLSDGKYYCIDREGRNWKTVVNPGSRGYCDGITFSCPRIGSF